MRSIRQTSYLCHMMSKLGICDLKYALTVINVANRNKEVEPPGLKESLMVAEVLSCIYRQGLFKLSILL